MAAIVVLFWFFFLKGAYLSCPLCARKKKKRQVQVILKYKIRERQYTDDIRCDSTHMHKWCILTIKQMLCLGNCHIWKEILHESLGCSLSAGKVE